MNPLHLSWLLVAGSACCNCIGTVLLKQSRLTAASAGFLEAIVSPWLIASLLVYSTGLLLFAKALDRLSIAAAVPCSTGLGFILVTILANWLFGEPLSIRQLAASSLIFAGIIVMTR